MRGQPSTPAAWSLGAATALCAAACIPCLAQQATVVVSHNDPDGIIEPGQTVQISATISWTGNVSYLFGVMGDVRASPDVGTAADSMFPYAHYATNPAMILEPGVPSGGSVLGLQIITAPQMWLIFGSIAYPWYVHTGIEILRFDWTAPATPGVVVFDFIPDPSLPEPTFMNSQSVTPFSLPTTFVGTSLTVIPAPGAGVALAAGLAGVWLRRRRTAR